MHKEFGKKRSVSCECEVQGIEKIRRQAQKRNIRLREVEESWNERKKERRRESKKMSRKC